MTHDLKAETIFAIETLQFRVFSAAAPDCGRVAAFGGAADRDTDDLPAPSSSGDSSFTPKRDDRPPAGLNRGFIGRNTYIQNNIHFVITHFGVLPTAPPSPKKSSKISSSFPKFSDPLYIVADQLDDLEAQHE